MKNFCTLVIVLTIYILFSQTYIQSQEVEKPFPYESWKYLYEPKSLSIYLSRHKVLNQRRALQAKKKREARVKKAVSSKHKILQNKLLGFI